MNFQAYAVNNLLINVVMYRHKIRSETDFAFTHKLYLSIGMYCDIGCSDGLIIPVLTLNYAFSAGVRHYIVLYCTS